MRTTKGSPWRGIGLCLAFLAGVCATAAGVVRFDRVALARPQDSGTQKATSATKRLEGGGLNPAEDRAETIRLLRSIDARLEAIADNTKKIK